MPTNLSQYVRIPGTARRYLDKETGKEISRWQYQILQGGGVNPKALAKERAKLGDKKGAASRAYSGYVKAFKRNTAKILGVKESQVKVRGDSEQAKEFRKTLKEIKQLNSKKAEIKRKLKGALPPLKRNELEHELGRTELKTHRRLQKINFRPKNMNRDEYEKWKASMKGE